MAKVMIMVDNEEDLKNIEDEKKILEEFGIFYDIKIFSGMDNLNFLDEFIETVEKTGVDVIIINCRIATHLPGIIASKTIVPVIGVPLPANNIPSEDNIFSIVQMPEGVPVACMSLGKAGVKNSAIFAIQILSRKDKSLIEKLKKFKNQFT